MAYGFKPVRHAKGGVVRPNSIIGPAGYTIATGYGTALYKGDAVALTTGGTLIVNDPGTTLPIGVFDGVEYTNSAGERIYSKSWPASTTATNIVAHVFDDPEIVFMVEADQVGTAFTSAYVGTSGDSTAGSGDSTTEISGHYLDTSGTWAGTAAELKVLGSAEQDSNWTSAGTAMDVFVKFNEHFWHNDTAGVASS